MNCIKCGSRKVQVIATRADGPRRIHRRRRCCVCGTRWTTTELPVGDLKQMQGPRKKREDDDEEYYPD